MKPIQQPIRVRAPRYGDVIEIAAPGGARTPTEGLTNRRVELLWLFGTICIQVATKLRR